MGADIYRAKYEYVLGPITQEQFDFIEDIIYRSDDGTYELSSEHFKELKQNIGEYEELYKVELKSLFEAFNKEIKKGKGHFSFRVFV